MPLSENVKKAVYDYCNNHLADDQWYQNEFDFIEDDSLRTRIIQEFKGIRFAYKLYEGINATDENLIFEVRHQIFAYATIYEAIIHHIFTPTTQIPKSFMTCNIILCLLELVSLPQSVPRLKKHCAIMVKK